MSMDVQLALEINEDRMSAYRCKNTEIEQIAVELCLNKSEAGYKESLQKLIHQVGDLDNYTSYTCSYSSPLNTLVPMSLFSSDKSHEILDFTLHQKISKSDTDYNRLFEWNIVNVFYIPLWIKSVLVMKVPRIAIQHEVSHVLRYLNTGSTIPQKTVIILHENHFLCLIRKEGKIGHFSYQNYQSASDVLYHLLYCYQQMNIVEKGVIEIYSSLEKQFDAAKESQQSMQKVDVFTHQKIELKQYNHINFQSLCV